MSYDESKALSPEDLAYVQNYVREAAAIVLTPEKAYLVEARLDPLARREGFGNTTELVQELRRGGAAQRLLGKKIVDAMTTNETSFFRDVHPFNALRKQVLSEIIARRAREKRLNIWCAACSSGQEPYTIAMILAEDFPHLSNWQVTFVASDISEAMLERCREGRFSKLEVNRGLPAALLVKYFEQRDGDWYIKEALRKRIDFRQINLVTPWPSLPRMDVVFIRNVLIYFDADTKRTILERIANVMDQDGYLFLGGTETTLNIADRFHRLRLENSTCYTLVPKEAPLVEAPSAAQAL